MATTRGIDVPVRAVYEDGTRVLLIQPDDVLLIGNVGPIKDQAAVVAAVKNLQELIGVKVVLFSADIDIAKLPTDA